MQLLPRSVHCIAVLFSAAALAPAAPTSRHCATSSRAKMLSWGLDRSRLYRAATWRFSSTTAVQVSCCQGQRSTPCFTLAEQQAVA